MATALLLGAWASSTTLVEGSLDRMRTDSPDLRAWILVMCVQAIPYVSAVIASLVSALPIPARWIGQGYLPVEGDEEYAQLVPDPLDAPPATAGAPAEMLPTSDPPRDSSPSSERADAVGRDQPPTSRTRKAS